MKRTIDIWMSWPLYVELKPFAKEQLINDTSECSSYPLVKDNTCRIYDQCPRPVNPSSLREMILLQGSFRLKPGLRDRYAVHLYSYVIPPTC